MTQEAKAHFDRGIDYYAEGQYNQVIDEFKEALKINPNYVDAYYNLGNVYYAKGEYNQAIDEYKEILRINPNDIEARFKLEKVYREEGEKRYKDNFSTSETSIYTIFNGKEFKVPSEGCHYRMLLGGIQEFMDTRLIHSGMTKRQILVR
ncbi:MAG: tetratricopeptide repeat protein [Deltaproteobacteria bacterium]|nr:tetratricopeptide repeat protein [Deltaproteobacteria bacterium]